MKNNSKIILDNLLNKHKAQPVGNGYIDIIVSRSNYKELASELIENDFLINAISWWEYVSNPEGSNTYGMGGPFSIFYEGWFAETGEIDECSENRIGFLEQIIELVENKELGDFETLIKIRFWD